jgi:prophage DNA circulation protein
MAWEDRLRKFVYLPPNGGRFDAQFDSLSRSGGRKAPVTELPGQDQARVQNLGVMTPRYPVDIYFSGPDYDQTADRFWNALDQDGAATIEHPRWGVLSVIPLTKSQTEQFVNGVGRAVFSIDFIRVSTEVRAYPRVRTSPSDLVSVTADAAVEQILADMADVDTTGLAEVAAIEGTVTETVAEFTELSEAMLSSPDVAIVVGLLTEPETPTLNDQALDMIRQISELSDEIVRDIDDVADAPVLFAQRLIQLHRLPSSVAISVDRKIKGYKAIATTLTDIYVGLANTYSEFAERISLAALWALLIGASESTTTGALVTRADAQEVVETLASIRSSIVEAVEDIGGVPNFEANALADSVATSAIDNVIGRALALPTEALTVLDRQITPLQFVWESDGNTDRLDEFIAFNRLSGDKILMLEIGDEVRWYV